MTHQPKQEKLVFPICDFQNLASLQCHKLIPSEGCQVLFGSNGKHYVHCRTREKTPKCLKNSVKGGGESLMVWGMFSPAGVGPIIKLHGRVNVNAYQNLLRQHAGSSLHSSPNQHNNFHAGQCSLSHSQTGQSQRSKPSKKRSGKSLATKLWPRKPLPSQNLNTST